MGGTISTPSGWIWSSDTGYESITTFLDQYLDPAQVAAINPGIVEGVALNGNVLSLTGQDKDGTTSFYAQVSVPEPTTLMLVPAAGLLLLRRRRSISNNNVFPQSLLDCFQS